MRIVFFVILATLLLPELCHSSQVQIATATTVTGTLAFHFPAGTTAGSVIIFHASWNLGTSLFSTTGVTLASRINQPGSTRTLDCEDSANVSAGVQDITAVLITGGTHPSGTATGYVVEEDGVTSSPFDVSAAASSAGVVTSAPDSGTTGTLAQSNEVIYGCGDDTVPQTVGAGYANFNAAGVQYYNERKTVSATTGVKAIAVPNGAGHIWNIGVLAYKQSAAGTANLGYAGDGLN